MSPRVDDDMWLHQTKKPRHDLSIKHNQEEEDTIALDLSVLDVDATSMPSIRTFGATSVPSIWPQRSFPLRKSSN